MLQRRVDADRLRISFGANQTWMAVAGIATNAGTGAWVLFIDPNPKRDVKRLEASSLKIIVQMLNALLVTDGRIFVGRAGVCFRWIFTAGTVHLIEVFGFGVIGFQLVVADGPRRRYAAVMTKLAKVFFAQTKQRRAIKFRIAAHEIIRMRVQLFAVNVAPGFFSVVLSVEVNRAGAPVVFLARHIVATFE